MNDPAKITLTSRGVRIVFEGHTRRDPRKLDLPRVPVKAIAAHFHGVGAVRARSINVKLGRWGKSVTVNRIDGAPSEWLAFCVKHLGNPIPGLSGIVTVPAFARLAAATAARAARGPSPQRTVSSGPYKGALRLKKPTQKHRPAMWEGILGAVYAMNDARQVKYFDFDYAGARAWCGFDEDGRDPRTARGNDYSWNERPAPGDKYADTVPSGRRDYICWVIDKQ